ncbi:MAG: hypothetical protein UHW99_00615 [Methanobrevibacter sp.]|nr:hypothetical protein [Methanobrevibacter sp.]
MVFTNEDFIDLMDFCKDINNFQGNTKKPFDHIYNISKSDGKHKHSLINDSRYWCFNLDNICINVTLNRRGRESNSRPASTDGLHYVIEDSKIKLYFLEFKGLPINSIDFKKQFSLINKSIKGNHCQNPRSNCPLSDDAIFILKKAQERYEDKIICQLNLKTTESLFFVLPKMYEYYCKHKGINYKDHLNEFITWLLNVEKNFIAVFYDKIKLSPTNKHFTFDNRLRIKFNHFKNVANINPIVVEKSLFEKDYLYEYFDRIDLPAYTSVDYVEFLGNNV